MVDSSKKNAMVDSSICVCACVRVFYANGRVYENVLHVLCFCFTFVWAVFVMGCGYLWVCACSVSILILWMGVCISCMFDFLFVYGMWVFLVIMFFLRFFYFLC